MASNGHNTQKHYFQELNKAREIKITPVEQLHFENTGSEEEADKWIEELSTFEELIEIAPRIPLREFVGSPIVRPPADINPSELETELDRILDILAEHNVYVEFLYLDDDFEAYRFIVEELLDEFIEDVPLCMNCHYIYEAFHPNDIEDAKMWAVEFLSAFFSNDRDTINVWIGYDQPEDCLIDAIPVAEMEGLLERLHTNNSSYALVNSRPVTANVQGDRAIVEMTFSWRLASCDLVDSAPAFGTATLYMKRSVYGGWDVTHLELPKII